MDNKMNEYIKTCILGLIIGISIIVSTLIYVNFNRYEYHSDDSIVFDKLTGKKYSPNTFSGAPQ